MDQRSTPTRQAAPDVIDMFSGPHTFLSNFHTEPFAWADQPSATAEHHYNAAKTLNAEEKLRVYSQPTPGRAKREGQKVLLRKGWDDHLKAGFMESILKAKFAPGTVPAQLLLDTRDALLIEGNTWHDQYWGQCTCEKHYHWPGSNTLGRLLMAQRRRLQEGAAPLTRVGIAGHQPQSLTPADNEWLAATLPALMRSLANNHGTQVAISGMAPGVDSLWANTALALNLKSWAYVPSAKPAEHWCPEERAAYTHNTAQSARLVTLGGSHDPRWVRARNDLMVRDSDALVAVHKEGKTSGATAATIRKARACGARLIRVNVTRREVTAVGPLGESPWVL